MNLSQLKYAVEVEKTKSITKAAKNLYMDQPNLSRAILELEHSLGTQLFNRTSNGVIPTDKGEEFLKYAHNILNQIEAVEMLFRPANHNKLNFSISIPRASYISQAFTYMIKKINLAKQIEFTIRETNNMNAISNILQNNYNLGIIRYQSKQEKYFISLLKQKNIAHEIIQEFQYLLLMPKSHPLANKTDITYKDLRDYIEIAHKDYYVPTLSISELKKTELPEIIDKRIYVYDRGSQFDLLCSIPTTYIWVSTIPDEFIKRYSLVQQKCIDSTKKYKDVLIYKKNYQFTDIDKIFINELNNSVSKLN